jgi:GNAT superfamily N-acetyltransferase
MSRLADVVITYLELTGTDPSMGSGHRDLPAEVGLRLEKPPDVATIAGTMYRAVGADFYWLDRVTWTDEQWRDEVDRAGVELWTARIGDAIAGYFELHVESDTVEVKYFGLTPQFVGRGLGGPLLSAAVRRAWSLRPGRVTLNTCTLDHPAALPNYLARGFRAIRTERQQRVLPS